MRTISVIETDRYEVGGTLMATIKDVARKANTSPSTVSRFLNGGKVRKGTEAAILKAIDKLDYKVHPMARGLKTNKTYTVAYIVPDLTNMFFAQIARGAQEVFYHAGYSLMLFSVDNNPEREVEIIRSLLSRKVDGILLSSVIRSNDHLIEIINHEIPMVLIDRMPPDLEIDSVQVDNVNGAYQATEALIDAGHRKIGIICGPQDLLTGRERYRGYLRAFEDYGLEVDDQLIKFGDFLVPSGYKQMCELLEQPERPTAVFVSNYYMCLGAIIALNEKNIKIPDDLSFVSFDDYELSKVYNPPLTAVEQPMIEIGEEASKILIDRMNGNQTEKMVKRLKTNLIQRGSIKENWFVQVN